MILYEREHSAWNFQHNFFTSEDSDNRRPSLAIVPKKMNEIYLSHCLPNKVYTHVSQVPRQLWKRNGKNCACGYA